MAAPIVSIGPLETIVNVGWATGKRIAVLKFSMSMQTKQFPLFPVTDLPIGTNRDLFTGNFKIDDPAITVVNPISPEMLSNLHIWQFISDYVGPNKDFGNIGQVMIFFNVSKILAIKPQNRERVTLFKINTPISTIETINETIYWIYQGNSLEENEANPFTTGDPFNNPPFGIMTLPRPFATAEERNRYSNLPAQPPFQPAERVETVTFNNNLSWTAEVFLFNNKLNFNETGSNDLRIVNSDLSLGPGEELITDIGGGKSSGTHPSRVLTVDLVGGRELEADLTPP